MDQHALRLRIRGHLRVLAADVLKGALAGTVPGAGFGVDQTFLTLTSVYILVPSLMVVVSLLAQARMSRVVNIIVSLLYAASVVVTVVGEIWVYYILGSAVEVALLLAIARGLDVARCGVTVTVRRAARSVWTEAVLLTVPRGRTKAETGQKLQA